MGSFVEAFQYEEDDTYELMCGLQPVTLEELHDHHFARLDRNLDFAPAFPSRWRDREPVPALEFAPPAGTGLPH
jgi:hypothetical protein